MTLFPEGHIAAANLIARRWRADGPATIPGHRAALIAEMGLPPETDGTDAEHDSSMKAHSQFTRLERQQLEGTLFWKSFGDRSRQIEMPPQP